MCLLAQGSGAGEVAAGADPGVPLGRLVDIGRHRLHIHCTGAGAPTVVLEAGLGGNHLDWVLVQPEIAKVTRVCSYDRAGYGWSDPGPQPRTAAMIAGELALLLSTAGIDGPLVMVGHSFGGALAFYYARQHPDQVAGLVLVDSMHPDQYERFHEVGIDLPVELGDGGLVSSPQALTVDIPEPYRPFAAALARREATRAAISDELRNMPRSLAEVNAAPPLPPMPAEVILHGRRDWDRLYRDGRMENIWIRLQADLARQVGATRLIVATGAGHQVPLEQPDLVVKMVRAVVGNLRALAR